MFSQQEKERIIEVFIYELNKLQTDDPEYFKYINAMKTVNLTSFTAADRDIIKDFLFIWGGMKRRPRTKPRPDDPQMSVIIQKYAQVLQQVRKQDLHISDLQPYKQTIVDLFEELYPLVGQISAAKTLHLICPRFFPLWDSGIISKYNSSYKSKYKADLIEMEGVANTKYGERASGKGYYDFMEFTKSFINKYYNQLNQIQTALNNQNQNLGFKTLLKIVDEFNMFATQIPFYYVL